MAQEIGNILLEWGRWRKSGETHTTVISFNFIVQYWVLLLIQCYYLYHRAHSILAHLSAQAQVMGVAAFQSWNGCTDCHPDLSDLSSKLSQPYKQTDKLTRHLIMRDCLGQTGNVLLLQNLSSFIKCLKAWFPSIILVFLGHFSQFFSLAFSQKETGKSHKGALAHSDPFHSSLKGHISRV